MHTYVSAYIHKPIHIYACDMLYTNIYTCTCIYMYIYTYMYIFLIAKNFLDAYNKSAAHLKYGMIAEFSRLHVCMVFFFSCFKNYFSTS